MIIGVTIGIRLYFFPIDVPLNNDALYYFWYSSDIYQIGGLPKEWSPDNNGWPIFTSIFFIMSDSKDVFALMQIQRLFSVLASILIIIPTYFLCKKFVTRKFALIGASLVAFDPRLMINSFLGVTDPIYLLLITTSLTLFLFSNKKIVYFSFALVALATIIRAEGLAFFVMLSIMFLIRYRKENYKVFFKYLLALGIFILIILPISLYRIEVIGSDGIFSRNFSSGDNLVSNVASNDSRNVIIGGLELFIKYLIWIMIPNFILFIPLGLFLIFQKRNFEKNTIILSLGIMSIPALYAYTIPAPDTRYLYVLFPMFSVLAVLSIEKIGHKLNKPVILVFVIILAIIVTSVLFYDQQKIDYKHERESFEIMKKISSMVKGTNVLYQESHYFNTIQTIEQWPNTFTKMKFDIITIPTDNYDSLEDYILASKDKGLTHIMIDDKRERPNFLKDVFSEDDNLFYLDKIYDSRIDGFTYHVKVFKIDYELFDSLKINVGSK
jgi:hypothetical protein